jgi:transposase
MRTEGEKYHIIAEKMGCSPSCVYKVVKKINTFGTARNLIRSGRKRCTTKRTDDRIATNVAKNRRITAKEIKKDLQSVNINCSESTIKRRLRERHFFGGIARKKPAISEKNRIKRLAFAKKYLNMPPAFWNKIIWSDESKFELINSKRRTRVWKRRKEGLIKKTILRLL